MSTNAKLCDFCGSGANQEKCIICGRPFSRNMAYLCSFCGAGANGEKCIKCGRMFAPKQAMLCSFCAVKYHNKCVKCCRYIS